MAFGDQVKISLELNWHDVNGDGIGDPQKSCITPGSYEMEWHLSPSKGWVYRLKDVKDRSEILLHKANLAGDEEAGYIRELLGCIAIGEAWAMFTTYRDQPIKPQHGVTGSKTACDLFYAWGNKEPVMLHIIENIGL